MRHRLAPIVLVLARCPCDLFIVASCPYNEGHHFSDTVERQGIDSQHLLADRSDLLLGVKTKRHLNDGSRIISVVMTACFQPRNRDSELKLYPQQYPIDHR
jgi:hypothetical protein